MHTLFLRLEGPLQAWGLRSRWGERDTAPAPTKSGVIGILGSALGLHRTDDHLRHLSSELRMGVRVDRPGTLLRDYHTTGGGTFGAAVHTGGSRYHDQPYVGGVLSAEVDRKGRIKVKLNDKTKLPETDVSERMYLADASFLVALQGPEKTITAAERALHAPVWQSFLGRKACVPSVPIPAGSGDYPDLVAALTDTSDPRRHIAHRADDARTAYPLHLLLETTPGNGTRQNDNIGTPARRVFLPRFVAAQDWSPDDHQPSLNTFE